MATTVQVFDLKTKKKKKKKWLFIVYKLKFKRLNSFELKMFEKK